MEEELRKFQLDLKMKVKYKVGENIFNQVDEGNSRWKSYITECMYRNLICKPITIIYNPALINEEDHFLQVEIKINDEKVDELLEFIEFKVKLAISHDLFLDNYRGSPFHKVHIWIENFCLLDISHFYYILYT